IENIILADGVGGNTIAGAIGTTTSQVLAQSGTKGWVVDGVAYTDGGGTNLNDKEVQRALFSYAIGLSWTEESLVSPKINRIILFVIYYTMGFKICQVLS
ncbi:MAG: hypothetical protein Q8Q91_01955, partial [Candidatus Daviesbacteria bacterium]|nr:hypothetical protein [Candidatus Daviesbacteria bacterium]